MIIRIMGEGQFNVPDDLLNQLNVIDNRIVEHVACDRNEHFRQDLIKLIETIKKQAVPLDPKLIVESDLIIPPADLSFDEAKKVFTGSGLIED